MFDRIVVGLDGSETSDAALQLACGLAKAHGSELHLVHAPQPKTVAFALGAVTGYHTATTMPAPDEVAKAGQAILDKGVEIATANGQQVANTHQDRGDPAQVIATYAEQIGADLIVTGRRGLGNLGALVQGSTSQKINHLAHCACLTVA